MKPLELLMHAVIAKREALSDARHPLAVGVLGGSVAAVSVIAPWALQVEVWLRIATSAAGFVVVCMTIWQLWRRRVRDTDEDARDKRRSEIRASKQEYPEDRP